MLPLVPLLRALGGIAFPPACVQCGDVCEDGGLRQVCHTCEATLSLVGPPHCRTCGHPFFGEVEGERLCPHCEGLHPAFREGRTVTLFKGPARAMVHTLKYRQGMHVLADMEQVIRRNHHVVEFLHDAVLVPVPLHSRKARERGYNQSALLAELFSQAGGGLPVVPLLQRVVDTSSQTAYDRKERKENLKNAFALAKGASISSRQRYILVDDVFTTGSTLNSCARELRRGGALNLDVVTFGHG